MTGDMLEDCLTRRQMMEATIAELKSTIAKYADSGEGLERIDALSQVIVWYQRRLNDPWGEDD